MYADKTVLITKVVAGIVEEYDCDPAMLEIEITETVAVQNIETTRVARVRLARDAASSTV